MKKHAIFKKSAGLLVLAAILAWGGHSFSQGELTAGDKKDSPDGVSVRKDASLLLPDRREAWQFKTVGLKNIPGAVDSSFFLDDKQWWVASKDVIYHSADGGGSWTPCKMRLPENARIEKLQFVNDRIGWSLVQIKPSDYVLDSGQNRYWLYVTRDGGKTWKEQISEQGTRISDFRFSDPENGMLTGNRFVEGGGVKFKSYFVRTSDGGKHWDDISKKAGELSSARELLNTAFFSGKNNVILAAGENSYLRCFNRRR